MAFSGCPRINFREEQWRESIFEDQNIIISPNFLDLWKKMCCINHLKSFLTMNSQWIFNTDTVFIRAVSQNCVGSSKPAWCISKEVEFDFHFMKGCCLSQNDQEDPPTRVGLGVGPLIHRAPRVRTHPCTHPFHYRAVVRRLAKRCLHGVLLGSSRSSPGRAAACVCATRLYLETRRLPVNQLSNAQICHLKFLWLLT